jgi:phage baseplate assembly protein W
MAGYSARLPLSLDPREGYAALTTIKDVALQNLKMVLYTEPGERIWDVDFGVGFKRYLFEQSSTVTFSNLEQRIRQQVSKYLPYIQILNLSINAINENNEIVESSNFVKVDIFFSISGVGTFLFSDTLSTS